MKLDNEGEHDFEHTLLHVILLSCTDGVVLGNNHLARKLDQN